MARKENEKGGKEGRAEAWRNVGKWYTIVEYYNEEGIQITKKEAIKNYIIVGSTTNTKINGNKGTKTIWKQCARNTQTKLL